LYSKGATLSNRYRMQEFRNLTEESQKLYEDLIAKQEISINDLKKELINSSSKDSYENILLLNEQSEERLQSKITYHTGLMLFSASFLSLVISYFLNR
jgi:translation initiation factor 2 beta subunit (eIF-2beta)/eIF-5